MTPRPGGAPWCTVEAWPRRNGEVRTDEEMAARGTWRRGSKACGKKRVRGQTTGGMGSRGHPDRVCGPDTTGRSTRQLLP
jgi:hypothetical protein